jgi:predicted dehydrogenase
MSKIRLGFVGVGGMGQAAHLNHYAVNGDCEIAAIAEIRPKLRAAVASRWNIPKSYPNHREMLAAEQLDAVVAIQPFSLHGQLIPELLAYGKPVLTEKPIARSTESADRILAAEQATPGAKLCVAYHKRSDPATMWVKERMQTLAASKELGALRYIRVTMPPGDWVANGFSQNIWTDDPSFGDKVAWDAAPASFSETDAKAHESFVNYYIHQVNLLRHLFGEAYRVTHADPAGVTMTVQSASGLTGLLEMAPYSLAVEWQETALVCYEKGWIRLRLFAPLTAGRAGEVEVCEDKGDGKGVIYRPTLPWIGAMQNQAANFLKAVRGEATPLCGAIDARADIEVANQYIRLVTAARGQAQAQAQAKG